MNDDFGSALEEDTRDLVEVANVSEQRNHVAVNGSRIEKVRTRFGRESETNEMGSQDLEPGREPAAFEPGMSGDKNFLAAIKRSEGIRHHQAFHGALPLAHSASRYCLSRIVSMGCQKPRWR